MENESKRGGGGVGRREKDRRDYRVEEKGDDMSKCRECGGDIRRSSLDEYREDLLGIPVTLVNSVVRETCVQCNDVHATVIPDLDGLIAAVAVTRAMLPAKLRGTDIRFTRKAIGVSGKSLAGLLEVAPATLSRWENGKEVIGPASEKLLRFVASYLLASKAPAVDCDPRQIVDMRIQSARLVDSDAESHQMMFERVRLKLEDRKTSHWDICLFWRSLMLPAIALTSKRQ